jgi:hypothetical protein
MLRRFQHRGVSIGTGSFRRQQTSRQLTTNFIRICPTLCFISPAEKAQGLAQPTMPVMDFAEFLPPAGARTWSARRKAAVVLAVRSGQLARADAFARYMLSEEELSEWEAAFDREGLAGLQLQLRRRRSR